MTVIFVAGAMRSGTTITGQVLSASPDSLLVGEVRPILRETHLHQTCDCGRTRADCPFWQKVEAALPDDFDEQAASRGFGLKHLPRILLHGVSTYPLPDDVQHARHFLAALAEAAGDKALIDTSKVASSVWLWRSVGRPVDLVLSVRSPRAVAAAQALPFEQTQLPSEPVLKSWLVWAIYNLAGLLARTSARTFAISRYSTMRNTPRAEAIRLWQRARVRPGRNDGTSFTGSETHMLVGNPRRERGSTVVIKPIR